MHDFCPEPPPLEHPQENNTHLMIGKVASLYDITVQTLRHYDKIGLFRPEVINPETGYRYYTISQLRQLEYILFLRKLEFSLPEIQEAMDALRQGADFSTLLIQRDRQLEAQMQELQKLRNTIAALVEMSDESPAAPGDICIRECTPPRTLLYQKIFPLNVADPDFSLRLMEYRKSSLGSIPPIQTQYSFGATVSLRGFRDTGALCYTGILLDPGLYKSDAPESTVTIPAGFYATLRFRREDTRPEEAYGKLSSFLLEHRFRADDTILECALDHSFSSISRLSELTELQVRISLT
jgi:DNA-binding transcriptional MerR regulator